MRLSEISKVMDYKPLMSSYEAFGLEEMSSQKISVVSDQLNGDKEKNDSFVLDIESYNNNSTDKLTPSSRITRNFSRKGSQNGGHKKLMASPTNNDKVRDFNTLSTASTSSQGASLLGCSTPKMPVPVAVGSTDLVANSEVHHQITITACNISTAAHATESRMINNNRRSYSFRRSPTSRAINPRKVLLFFATLSSMGSILLIYLTLSVRKLSGNDDALVWQE